VAVLGRPGKARNNREWLPWHTPTVGLWILSVQTCDILIWYLLRYFVDSLVIFDESTDSTTSRVYRQSLARLQSACNWLQIFSIPLSLSFFWVLTADILLNTRPDDGDTEVNVGYWEVMGFVAQFAMIASITYILANANLGALELREISVKKSS